MYSFVFMDAIYYKVREDKDVVVKAAYVVIGANLDGEKEVLGIWIGANESSEFWPSVLNDLKHRGVQDVLIFCVDGLNDFKEAIRCYIPIFKDTTMYNPSNKIKCMYHIKIRKLL